MVQVSKLEEKIACGSKMIGRSPGFKPTPHSVPFPVKRRLCWPDSVAVRRECGSRTGARPSEGRIITNTQVVNILKAV